MLVELESTMPFLGITRQRTAHRRAVTVLITELAKIDKGLWRRPIEERKALIAAMRISCKVPDNLGDLDSQTVELIARSDGRKTADAFIDAAKWVNDANEFVSTVTEARLDSYHTDNPSAKLYRDIEGITDSTNQHIVYTGSAKFCQEYFDEIFKQAMPTLVHTFLNAVFNNFERRIQGGQPKIGFDCHWGKTFPKQYISFIDLKKQKVSEPRLQNLMNIMFSAVEEGSNEVGRIVNS